MMRLKPDAIAEIQRRAEAGESLSSIAKLFGVGWTTVKYHTSKAWADKHRATVKGNAAMSARHAREAERLPPRVDRDHPELTGRICGDPAPGRSALDAKPKPIRMQGYGTVEL